jgi:Protein of unknown function (DUF3618)
VASSDGTKQAAHGKAATGDTDALVRDIERTRAELAETIDAIADKVSPKRVAGRAKESLREGAATAKERLLEAAGTAKGKVSESASTAKEVLAGAVDRSGGGSVALDQDATAPHGVVPIEPPLDGRPLTLPPAGGVAVPRLSPGPLHSVPGSGRPAVPPEYVAVGVATALMALAVWWEGRRR